MTNQEIVQHRTYTITSIKDGHRTLIQVSKGNVSDYSKFVPHNFTNITNIEKAKKCIDEHIRECMGENNESTNS